MPNGRLLGTTGFKLHDGKFYGLYRATVLDNVDPLQAGRIKAEVIPYFVGIASTLLPWAVPKNPMFSGAGTGSGSFTVPDIGSKVWVFFENGDMYQPVYDGEAPDLVNGLPSFRTTNYPNRRGWKTSSGITFYVDDTAETLNILHPTGTAVTVSADGSVTVNSVATVTIQGLQVQINPV